VLAAILITTIVLCYGVPAHDFTAPPEPVETVMLGGECLDATHITCVCKRPVVIPDNDPEGITLGPLVVPAREFPMCGIIFGILIEHDHTADLAMRLHYDSDNDGIYDVDTPVEIYLARSEPCIGEELWACPLSLGGAYYFKDEDWKEYGEEASLKSFEGLPTGGCFYLTMTDKLEGDTGVVRSWGVFILNQGPVAGNHTN